MTLLQFCELSNGEPRGADLITIWEMIMRILFWRAR
jgi:hypothetical protein